MITEIVTATAGMCLYKYLTSRKYYFKKAVEELYKHNTAFKNSMDRTVKFKKYQQNDFGEMVTISFSKVMSFKDLKKERDYLKSYFKVDEIEISETFNHDAILFFPFKENNFSFKLQQQNPHELIVGQDSFGNYKKVDLNKFPHVLIGGDTGTGKSRFLMMALTNLVATSNVNLYLLQIRKSDLIVFKDCYQTKSVVRNLDDALMLLGYLDNLCKERDKKIESLMAKGIFNIEDYNKYVKYDKMKYCYIVLDEFSFFNVNGSDSKAIKIIKRAILGLIKNIVMVGRSVGVFIITSLQKPTSTSIPTDIKSQLCTRVCFKMLDEATSIQILGNGDATKIKTRRAVIRSLESEVVSIPFIDFNLIEKYIASKKDANKKYISLLTNSNSNKNQSKDKNKKGVINEEVLKNVRK